MSKLLQTRTYLLLAFAFVVVACDGGSESVEGDVSITSTPTKVATTVTTTTTSVSVDINPSVESLTVNGTPLQSGDGVYVLAGVVNPGDVLRIEAMVRDDQPGALKVFDVHDTYAPSPEGTVVEVTVSVPGDLNAPEIPILLGDEQVAVIEFEPGDEWVPVVSVDDPTGVTGDVTLEVRVIDLNGPDTIESLSVVQEFNFQHPDHANGVIARTGLEPRSIEDLASGATAVRFDDPRFDFVFTADKEITEYVSTNPLSPIDVTGIGSGVYEISFHTEWPGRHPLQITALDTDGNAATIRIPIEVYWAQNPWDIRGVAIEFNYLGGNGRLDVVDHLIELARDQQFNFIYFTPILAMDSPDSVELQSCDAIASLRDECLSPTFAELESMINAGHAAGLGVMLKPHVFSTEFFPHDIQPTSWDSWFDNYSKYVVSMAELAQKTDVEIVSIGNELQTSQAQAALWRDVITRVRDVFSGEITYSDFTQWTGTNPWTPAFPLESQLDYHGVPFYYPGIPGIDDLSADGIEIYNDPTMEEMEDNIDRQIRRLLIPRMDRSGNPAIATELGRFNHDGAAYDPWGQRAWPIPLDNQEQVDYFEAALRNASRYLDGVFFWSYKAVPDSAVPDYGIDIRQQPIHDLVAIWSAD